MLRFAAMIIPYLFYAMWMLPVPVFVCLAVSMLRRRLHTRLPLFFAYCLFQIIDFGIGFYLYHHSLSEYSYTYWITTGISVGLGFGVIYEVFTEVFRPFIGLRDLGRTLFRWATLVMSLAALMMAVVNGPSDSHPLLVAVLMLGRSVRIMQCGLVLLMLLCSSYLGLSWRHRIFGISVGFGIIGAVDLIAVTLMSTWGLNAAGTLSLVKMAAFLFAALLWAGYMMSPEPERMPASESARADQWNFSLAAVVHPGGAGPALPLIQDAVERVFEKTNGKKNGDGHPHLPRPHDQ